jgi:3,4-dihydroxy 2-butanone 4-phosphate synthase / GTP cyclohydrolase II
MVQVLAERTAHRPRIAARPGGSNLRANAEVIAELAAGRPVVVIASGGLDGHLVFAADVADVTVMAFAVRHTSGFLCVALPASRCDQLKLPPMWPTNAGRSVMAYTVAVDAKHGISTGISAADRAHTVRLLADPRVTAADFNRPGHVMVAATQGTGSFADVMVELVVAAGSSPAAVFGAIVSPVDPTRMANGSELGEFARSHGLLVSSVAGW